MSTAEELRPIAERVLGWVAAQRQDGLRKSELAVATDDDLRRIELCAMATLETSMLYDLYPPT